MVNYSVKLKRNLKKIINSMAKDVSLFVKDPGRDFIRNRKLDFSTMLMLLISMGGKTLNEELLEYFNFKDFSPTGSAFIQQRSKIQLYAFEYMLKEFNKKLSFVKTYKNYRLLAVDGSDLKYAANPNDKECYFYNKRTLKAYNMIHLNAVYDLLNKTYVDAYIQTRRKSNERKALNTMVDRLNLPCKAIYILDRGYEGYNTMAHIEESGNNYLMRAKDINSSGILSGYDLSDNEFDITIKRLLTRKNNNIINNSPDIYKKLKPKTVFDFISEESNDTYEICFRVVRIKLEEDKYECLITNLPEDEFSAEALRDLYALRWGIETSFRELKYTIGLVNFHSKKAEFICQEIFARLVTYNFCESITNHTVITTKTKKYVYEINFSSAVFICKRFLRQKKFGIPLNVEALISKYTVPIRKNRKYKINLKSQSYVSFIYRIA